VDVAGAGRRGLAVEAVFPEVRAEVGHQRIIGRGLSQIKSGSTCVPFEGLNTWEVLVLDRHARHTTTSCSSDFKGDWCEQGEGFNRGRFGTDRQEAMVLVPIIIALIPSLEAGG
jgi:hypothetical protein